MRSNSPTLSIVTTCYNAERGIQRTFDSIRELKKKTQEVEYIVQDGDSMDGTAQIINKNIDIIDQYKSEPDRGIYDGMNKAAKNCTGKYMLFINADDTVITSGIIEVLVELKKETLDFLACNVQILNSQHQLVGKRLANLAPLNFHHSGMPCSHQGFICKTEIFRSLGGYSNEFKIAGDYDFIIRCLKNSNNFKNFEKSIAKYPLGGLSYGNVAKWENFKIQRKNISLANSIKNLFREFLSVNIQRILPDRFVQAIKKSKGSQYSFIQKK